MPLTMTRAELVDRLKSKRGAFFTTLTTRTKVKMNKKKVLDDGTVIPNTLGEVEKIAVVNVGCNEDYEKGVRRRREKENQPVDENGEVELFYAEPLPWGHWVCREDGKRTPVIEHKEKLYVRTHIRHSVGYEYRDATDANVDKDVVHQFVPQREEGARQQVDDPIICRTYSLDSIVQITTDGGLVYEITN